MLLRLIRRLLATTTCTICGFTMRRPREHACVWCGNPFDRS